jgi:hypothetical protein
MDSLTASAPSVSNQYGSGNKNLPTQPFTKVQHPMPVQSVNSSSCIESTTRQLDKLPLEIIQRIVSHISCMDVLALRLVCSHLYHACSYMFVLKTILDRSSIQTSYSAHSLGPAWYNAVLSPVTPFSSWVRYALAHEEVERLIKDLGTKHGEVQLKDKLAAPASCFSL